MWQRKSDNLYCEYVIVNGKRKTVTAKTKPELKRKIAKAATYQEHGRTFTESAEAWQNAHGDNLGGKTVRSYSPHVKRAVAHFDGFFMKDITPDMVQAYIDGLARQRFARATIHRALNVVNMIFDYEITSAGSAVKMNPCGSVKIPKGLQKSRREPPSEDQLIRVTPDSEMGLFAFFLLYTGLRRGELLALKWEDIDFKNKLIHVRKGVTFESNQPHVKDRTKTEAGMRDVVLLDVLADVLPRSKHGYVFGGEKPLTNTQFRKRWIAWCRSAGLAKELQETHKGSNGHTYTRTIWKPLVTPHQFRHEYASILEDAGISEFSAKSLLGHSSITVTKDIYTHIRERKANKGIADVLNTYIATEKHQ